MPFGNGPSHPLVLGAVHISESVGMDGKEVSV